MKFVTEPILKDSKGYIRDFFATDDKDNQRNPNNTDLYLQMYETDPVIFSAINMIVNKTIGQGYDVDSTNKQGKAKLLNKLKDLGFELLLPNLVRNILIYGDAFLELVYNGSDSVEELHVLETREMEIKQNLHGEVTGYTQKHAGKDDVDFLLDEVVHYRNVAVGGRAWGFSTFKTLLTTVATKKFAETQNRTRFQNNSPRMVWIAKDASDDQIKQLITYLKLAKGSPHKDIVVEGDIDFRPLNTQSDDNIPLLEYQRTQILMALQIPPIVMGLPDNSNRSNSEVQVRTFDANVHALQVVVTDATTRFLFKLLGFETSSMSFKPIDKRDETQDMDIAKGLKELGVATETIIEFLRDAGLQLPDKIKIDVQQPFSPGQKDDKSEDKSNKPFTGKKTGRDAETRPEQLIGKTKNFGRYPYTYEVQ